MWLNALLTDSSDQTSTSAMPAWVTWVILGGLVVLLVLFFFFSGRKNKASRTEYIEQLAAIQPGHKVKTAGGINGIVVEVCNEDNTIILETGSETAGKSYLKIDKELIAQTDAKGPTQLAREAAEAARKAEKEAKAAGKTVEAPVEEAPAEEATETPAEEPADKE